MLQPTYRITLSTQALRYTQFVFGLQGLLNLTHRLVSMQYIIPYLLGFDELFQEGGGEQPEAFGTDWSRPPSNEPPVPMPTSAPF